MVPICWFHLLVPIFLVPVADSICFALGNKSGSFCEAVNCERSEQEGKFLFATLWLQKSIAICVN